MVWIKRSKVPEVRLIEIIIKKKLCLLLHLFTKTENGSGLDD